MTEPRAAADRLPHPLVLLVGAVFVAAVLTWLIPAGSYERVADAATGREVVVPGTWAAVAATPVGPAAAVLAVPRGVVLGADVVIGILFVGGVFVLLDETGALRRLVGALVGRTTRPRTIVVAVSLLFGLLGALDNTYEEIVALVPILLLLSRGLGFGPITALAMSVGAATVGATFSPTNPFAAGVANRFAGLPLAAGTGERFVLLLVAMAVWIAWTLARANADIAPGMNARASVTPEAPAAQRVEPPRARDALLLAVALVPFVPYIIGVLRFDWGFNELSAVFFVTAFAIGLLSGLNLRETAASYLRSMEPLLGAALFVGVARGISVVLTDGQIIDTIIYGLSQPLASLPPALAAVGMVPAHALLHLVVPSNSGHATLAMPILAPLADLLGLSRETAVLAYLTGGPPMDLISPTAGALLAMLLAAGVPYGRWLRFAVPGMLLIMGVGVVGLLLVA